MFTHLHLHTDSSLADSILKLDDAFSAAAADGQCAMAITDHGNLGSHFRALCAAGDSSVKPLLGVEAYLDVGLPPHPDGYPRLCHLVLIAKDIEGYRNLVRIQRQAWTENLVIARFPALTFSLLEKFHHGLVCTTACVGGPVGRAVGMGLWDVAEDHFVRLNELFGEDFYGEVSAHPLAEQPETNRAVALFAKRAGRRIVQTVDSHYLRPTDWITHDCMLKTKDKRKSKFRYPAACFYLAPEWRVRSYGLNPEWIEETNRVAEKCSADEELQAVIAQSVSARESAVAPAEEIFLSKSIPITPYDALRSAWLWSGLPQDRWAELAPYARRLRRLESSDSRPIRAFAKKHPALWSIAGGLESLPRAVCPDFKYKICVPEILKDLIPVRVVDGIPVAELDHATARQLHLPVRATSETDRRPYKALADFYKGQAFWWNDQPKQAVEAFRSSITNGGPIQAKIRLAQSLREIGKADESDKWLKELRQDPHIESLHLKKFVMAVGRPESPPSESTGIQLRLYPEVAQMSFTSSSKPDIRALQKACEPVVSNGIPNVIVSLDGQAPKLKPLVPRLKKYLKSHGIALHITLALDQIPSMIDIDNSKSPTRLQRKNRRSQPQPTTAE